MFQEVLLADSQFVDEVVGGSAALAVGRKVPGEGETGGSVRSECGGSDASARALQELGAEPLRGSRGDAQLLTDAARAADGVIQNAFDLGADFATASAEEAKAVHALITALQGSDKPLVCTSGTGGLGDTGSVVYDEETPIAASESPTVRALQLRFETEKVVTGATGLRGVALRPPNVFGRGGGRSVLWLIGAAGQKLGAVPCPVEAGDNLWSLVHVDDLADLYVLAVEKAPGGELFHATSRSGLRTQDVAAAISRGAGLGGKTVALDKDELAEALGAPPLADYWCSGRRVKERR